MACLCLGTAGFACAPMLAGFNPILGRDLCCVALWCRTRVLDGYMQLQPASILCVSWGFSLEPLSLGCAWGSALVEALSQSDTEHKVFFCSAPQCWREQCPAALALSCPLCLASTALCAAVCCLGCRPACPRGAP